MDSLFTSSLLDPSSILNLLYPTQESCRKRDEVFNFLQSQITNIDPSAGTFAFGSRPLKVYLPGGDIDIGVILPSWRTIRFFEILSTKLTMLSMQSNSELLLTGSPRISAVNFVSSAEVKLLKCIVDGIPIDITANTLTGLCAVVFFERISEMTGRDNLFKRAVLLVKTWMANEARILASHQFLLSSYAVETMVLFTINFFHADLSHTCKPNLIAQPFPHMELSPLAVLWRFLHLFAYFDFQRYCITIAGPVALSQLPEVRTCDIMQTPTPSTVHLPADAIAKNPSIRALSWVALAYPSCAVDALLPLSTLQQAVLISCAALPSNNNDSSKQSSQPLSPRSRIDLQDGFPALVAARSVVTAVWPGRPQQQQTQQTQTSQHANTQQQQQHMQSTQSQQSVLTNSSNPSYTSKSTLSQTPELSTTTTTTTTTTTPTTPAPTVPSLLLPSPPTKALFGASFLIIDPLDATNNIGRSVSVANQSRISSALLKGYRDLSSIVETANEVYSLPTEPFVEASAESLGLSLDEIIPTAMAVRDVSVSGIVATPSYVQRMHAQVRQRLYSFFFHSLRKYTPPQAAVALTPYLPYNYARALQLSFLPSVPSSPSSPAIGPNTWSSVPGFWLEQEIPEPIQVPEHTLHLNAINRLMALQEAMVTGSDIYMPLLTQEDFDEEEKDSSSNVIDSTVSSSSTLTTTTTPSSSSSSSSQCDQWWYTDGASLHSQLSMLKVLMAESCKIKPVDRTKTDKNTQQQLNQKKKKSAKKPNVKKSG